MSLTLSTPEIDDDGDPVWAFPAGSVLVPDVLAWERLGVGTRCETWLGWSTTGWCPVVVKLPRPLQRHHPRARQALAREVAALQHLSHPALPPLVHADLDADTPYVVVQYLDGDALDEVLDDGPLDRRATAMLGVQLLSAVAVLHRRGLAHLDVKPENVMIVGHRPVLVDFGSARPIGSRQPTGRPVGTVGYTGPDMEACQPISAAMDVYGVGATLREAFTGHRVYDLDPARRGTATAPHYPGGDPGLEKVIRRMTAADPDHRPTVAAALDALAATLEPDDRPWPHWAHAD